MSFTKNIEYKICVSKEFLGPTDKVLLVDDIPTTRNAVEGILDIISLAGSTKVGVGIVIEKDLKKETGICEEKESTLNLWL